MPVEKELTGMKRYSRRDCIWVWGAVSVALLKKEARGQQGPPGRADHVSVLITQHGFQMERLRARPGRIEFILVNRSGIDNVALSIDRVLGNLRIKSVTVPRHRRDFPDVVELGVGDYVLSIAGHPQWRLPLRVEPN